MSPCFSGYIGTTNSGALRVLDRNSGAARYNYVYVDIKTQKGKARTRPSFIRARRRIDVRISPRQLELKRALVYYTLQKFCFVIEVIEDTSTLRLLPLLLPVSFKLSSPPRPDLFSRLRGAVGLVERQGFDYGDSTMADHP